MREICVVVEGQSEERFVKTVLGPAALARDTHLQPIIVRTKRTATAVHKGGGNSWAHYRNLVRQLSSQPQFARIAVMFDLYACPSDTPGYGTDLRGRHLHARMTEAVQQDLEPFAPGRVLAGPVLHEFETLVLAAIATGTTDATDDVLQKTRAAISTAGNDVEMVNDGRATAPSKRLEQWWPGYEKVLYGPALIDAASWDAVASQCPTFASWVRHLLQ